MKPIEQNTKVRVEPITSVQPSVNDNDDADSKFIDKYSQKQMQGELIHCASMMPPP